MDVETKFFKLKVKAYIALHALCVTALSIILLSIPIFPESENSFYSIIADYGLFFFGVTLLFYIINGWFTGIQFDTTWKEKLIQNKFARTIYWSMVFSNNYPLRSRMTRAAIYAFNIVQKNKTKKNPASNAIFNGYDFRGNARFIDKVFSFAFAYSFLLFVISLGAMLAIKIINHFIS